MFFRRIISLCVLTSFLLTLVVPAPRAYAESPLGLPQPGTMVNLSPAYMPVIIKGMKVHPENPLLFDFILDTGKSGLKIDNPAFKKESEKLIKYFLAALTIKEDDSWGNLSPYEKSRMMVSTAICSSGGVTGEYGFYQAHKDRKEGRQYAEFNKLVNMGSGKKWEDVSPSQCVVAGAACNSQEQFNNLIEPYLSE